MMLAEPGEALNYVDTAMAQDLAAYSDVLKTVSSTKDFLLNPENSEHLDLEDPACFTDSAYINNLLEAYANGGVLVFMDVAADGFEVSSSIDD